MPRKRFGIGFTRRGGGAAAPTPPTGAVFAAIAHPAYCASDAAHLVPCAAGDSIRWWKDAVSGTWCEQSTSGNRFVMRKDGSGKWYAESLNGTQEHTFAITAFGLIAAVAVAQQDVGATSYPMVFSQIGVDFSMRKLFSATWGHNNAADFFSPSQWWVGAANTTTSGGVGVKEVVRGRLASATAAMQVRLSGVVPGRAWEGRIYGVAAYATIDDAQFAAALAWGQSL